MTTQTQADPNRWKALAVLGIAYLMVVLDVSIVNVALPDIATELKFGSDSDLQWVISGYGLTFGGLLLLGGRLGDILGRRKVFMVGLALFGIFSLLCGLATSPAMLITFRFLQGAAGAILSPSVFSIVSVTFQEGAERNKALGILGAIAGSGAAIGVLAGGFLTEGLSWEWIFFVNVPIAIVALGLVMKFVKESHNEGGGRSFDVLGAVLVTASLMVLVYALTEANDAGWGSGQTIGLLLLSVALMAAFLFVESRSKAPLMPLSFFKRRTPVGANIIGLGLGTMVFGMFFLLSLYMGRILGLSPIETGYGYLAVALTAVVASGAAQAMVTRIGVRPALAFGMLMLGVGLFLFTQIDPKPDGTYWKDLFVPFVLTGIGLGFAFVPVSIAALAGVPPHEAGLASGFINTSQQIGGAVGVAILTAVATSSIGDDQSPASVTNGYANAFWVGVVFAVVSLLATLFLLRKSDLAAPQAGVAHVG